VGWADFFFLRCVELSAFKNVVKIKFKEEEEEEKEKAREPTRL